ncbi:histidine kinase [[Phormidium ambiguum] IAM M-71]|uniref:Histidine kinase n=1 Tax=[Phormidium ambiguum] IAM M-71 TaxID=454136 RepID=A0A1U7ILN2_9CYAN|nr:CHASE2 domain-containing protein [Phormidium ambiguum]OKH38079.1 histidine kinase [Phormidium ambiguum IAM M-71]
MQQNIWQIIQEQIRIWRAGTVPGILAIGVIIIARGFGYFQSLELAVFDLFLRLRPPEAIDERITIIGINEQDIQTVKNYPIPDRDIAALINKLQAYKPTVIGLDIIRDLPVEPGHSSLVATFKNTKNLIGIEKVLPAEFAPPPTLPAKQVGFVDAILDYDGNLRRSLLASPTPNGYKFSLSLKLAEAYLSSKGIDLENGLKDPEAMRFRATELPRFLSNTGGYVKADNGGIQILLNFRSGYKRFRRISLNELKKGNFNPNWLRDRIVIIGLTAASVKDNINTAAIPSKNPAPGVVYGVEIQAHAVSQIVSAVLDNRPLLQSWSESGEYLWIVFWGILGISLGKITQKPGKNILVVSVAGIILLGIAYFCIIWGWWIPVLPPMILLVVNGVGLTAFYQYDRALRARISDRQMLIDRTFDTIHNGPLQKLAIVLRDLQEENSPQQQQLIKDLKYVNSELRAIYEFMQKETVIQADTLYLEKRLEINLQAPIHELFYQVYVHTLERDLPGFQTLRIKVYSFIPIDNEQLSIEEKQGLCRFLEEALCNVGKHAIGVTRLNVTCTEKDNFYTLSIVDNGQGINSSSEGRGTQQFKNLARQLRGKFNRQKLATKGTICEIIWPVKKKYWWKFW